MVENKGIRIVSFLTIAWGIEQVILGMTNFLLYTIAIHSLHGNSYIPNVGIAQMLSLIFFGLLALWSGFFLLKKNYIAWISIFAGTILYFLIFFGSDIVLLFETLTNLSSNSLLPIGNILASGISLGTWLYCLFLIKTEIVFPDSFLRKIQTIRNITNI